jgi:hypothetical protein
MYALFEGGVYRPIVFQLEFALVATDDGPGAYAGIAAGSRFVVGDFLIVPAFGLLAATGARDVFFKLSVEARVAVSSGLAVGITGGLRSDPIALGEGGQVVPLIRAALTFR